MTRRLSLLCLVGSLAIASPAAAQEPTPTMAPTHGDYVSTEDGSQEISPTPPAQSSPQPSTVLLAPQADPVQSAPEAPRQEVAPTVEAERQEVLATSATSDEVLPDFTLAAKRYSNKTVLRVRNVGSVDVTVRLCARPKGSTRHCFVVRDLAAGKTATRTVKTTRRVSASAEAIS